MIHPTKDALKTPPGALLEGLIVPIPKSGCTPVAYAEAIGDAYVSSSKRNYRKSGGHYITPVAVARFMADSFPLSGPHARVLDPGSGTGILSAATCEAASNRDSIKSLHVDAYETDPLLARFTSLTLAYSRDWLARRDVELTYDVRNRDFVLEYAPELKTASDANRYDVNDGFRAEYDLVISNPPYFKIGKNDPRAVAWASVVHGQPNIYALFMAISAELLAPFGELVYIVPRSFASGPYFRRFRETFFRRVAPKSVHLFESRKDVFKDQSVLQENIVITARRRTEDKTPGELQVLVSHSKGAHDLAERRRLLVDFDSVMDPASENRELSIPLCEEDVKLVQILRTWPNRLHTLGLKISTGPVVPFRAAQFLSHAPAGGSLAPLLWMHHVRPMRTNWPSTAKEKPQWIKAGPQSAKLLLEDETYVLLRRFSAKEEKRRLVSAPLIRGSLGSDMVGLENHLNFVRGDSRELDEELAYGLSALFNSTFLDRYFRMSNGNTQVSATELRALPLPPERDIRSIGAAVKAQPRLGTELRELDALVAGILEISPELCTGLESVVE